MLSRSISCLWITFCLHLCCLVDSGEAQNAKEGKLLKFGAVPYRRVSKTSSRISRTCRISDTQRLCSVRVFPSNSTFCAKSKGGCFAKTSAVRRDQCDSAALGLSASELSVLRTAVKRRRTRITQEPLFFILPRCLCAIDITSRLVKRLSVYKGELWVDRSSRPTCLTGE